MKKMDIKISSKPLSIERAISSAATSAAGGTVVFVGTVRSSSGGERVRRMELESAEGLAENDLRRIAKQASARFGLEGLSVHHRVGKLKVGDPIVVIAASAAHRKEAFAACRFVIDEIKKSTPIWKKEFGRGRAGRWVQMEG